MARTSRGRDTTDKLGKAIIMYGKFRDSLMEITPLVDKLNAYDKEAVAVKKSLQGFDPDNPKYSDSEIKKSILSRLGVASGKYDDYDVVTRDSAGNPVTRKEQKEQNPSGFRYGGKVSRGRPAQSSAEKRS
jgi:hypothetical protein